MPNKNYFIIRIASIMTLVFSCTQVASGSVVFESLIRAKSAGEAENVRDGVVREMFERTDAGATGAQQLLLEMIVASDSQQPLDDAVHRAIEGIYSSEITINELGQAMAEAIIEGRLKSDRAWQVARQIDLLLIEQGRILSPIDINKPTLLVKDIGPEKNWGGARDSNPKGITLIVNPVYAQKHLEEFEYTGDGLARQQLLLSFKVGDTAEEQDFFARVKWSPNDKAMFDEVVAPSLEATDDSGTRGISGFIVADMQRAEKLWQWMAEFYVTDTTKMIPIYDNYGNLLFPHKLDYTDVKQMSIDRDGIVCGQGVAAITMSHLHEFLIKAIEDSTHSMDTKVCRAVSAMCERIWDVGLTDYLEPYADTIIGVGFYIMGSVVASKEGLSDDGPLLSGETIGWAQFVASWLYGNTDARKKDFAARQKYYGAYMGLSMFLEKYGLDKYTKPKFNILASKEKRILNQVMVIRGLKHDTAGVLYNIGQAIAILIGMLKIDMLKDDPNVAIQKFEDFRSKIFNLVRDFRYRFLDPYRENPQRFISLLNSYIANELPKQAEELEADFNSFRADIPHTGYDFVDMQPAFVEGGFKRLKRLIENVRTMLAAGKVILKKEQFPLGSFVDEAFMLFANQAREKSVTLDNKVGPSIMLFADKQAIERVIQNLVANAIKFTPPGGQISVDASYADGFVQISISDTGIGIRRDFLPYIFEPFVKADGLLSKAAGPDMSEASLEMLKGEGLGLAIVKEIIQAHLGTIEVESRFINDYPDNHGTTFTISLPIAIEADALAAGAPGFVSEDLAPSKPGIERDL